MKWTGTERRMRRDLRSKVAEVGMRLGISQREAYRLISENHVRKPQTR